VEDIGRVHGFERTQSLVDEVLAVVVGELLRADDSVHVSLHELLNEINLCERLQASWLLDVENGYDILMIKVSEELHFTKRSQTEHGVVEWSDLLDCDFLA